MYDLKSETQEHKKLVSELISGLRSRKGVAVKQASYPGYVEPEKVGRHEPDLIGFDYLGKRHLGEAKTEDDINSTHSTEQFYDFSRLGDFLHIMVPMAAETKLRSQLTTLQLQSLIGVKIFIWVA